MTINQTKPVAAVVLCAGRGERMKSKTTKMLHDLCGRPLCAWSVGAAVEASNDKVVVVLGHQATDVKAALEERFPGSLTYVVQTEQRGTGHALQVALAALPDFDGTLLVCCGDTPLIEAKELVGLVHVQQASDAPLAFLSLELAEPTGYGRVLRGKDGQTQAIVEEREATDEQRAITEINSGIYAMDAAFARDAAAKLVPSAVKHEYYLTDLVATAASKGGAFAKKTEPHQTHLLLGVNDRVQLQLCELWLRLRINTRWMESGVTLAAGNVHIDADVELAPDVTVGPHVVLRGKTRIDSGAVIEVGTVLTDTVVGENSVVHPYSVCEQAVIGRNASVGPFARLRPDSVLDEAVRVGNFVEVKKSHLRRDAKANHLAYVGDADVGEGTNIGAGTIMCNYDGFEKHRTTLGQDVFIGSNSTLVAPLAIEDGAYVAAGSVITQHVPADATAFGRARQENKEGYAKTLRERRKKSS
jgi:bifunctional UDP-N-acetylglucosamine pyrophosphorylase/glucosamine-1-phosphate N-acetyltransferase